LSRKEDKIKYDELLKKYQGGAEAASAVAKAKAEAEATLSAEQAKYNTIVQTYKQAAAEAAKAASAAYADANRIYQDASEMAQKATAEAKARRSELIASGKRDKAEMELKEGPSRSETS
jgi:hypothetical protein